MDDNTQQMIDAVNNLTNNMGGLTNAFTLNTEIQKAIADKMGVKLTDVQKSAEEAAKSLNETSAAAKSQKKAQEEYNEKMRDFKEGIRSAGSGLKEFGSSLLDSSRSFAKYNSALDKVGDAAISLGKSFGGAGLAAGVLVSAFASLTKASFKQTDAVLKEYDNLAKVGGAAGISTKELLDMGINAGFMSKDLNKLTGIIKDNSQAITSLGSGFASGAKVFGELAAVGTDTIGKYSKLGVSQEELIKTQADYIALQVASGRSVKGELADKKALQRTTLEYQDNLLTLSALTGENVAEIKNKQKEALSELNWQIAQRQLENKAAKLEREGGEANIAAAKKIREEMKARAEGLGAVAAIGSKGLTEAIREMQATGTATSAGAKAMIRMGLGPAMDEYNKTIKEGGDKNVAAAKLQQRYIEAQNKSVDSVGTAAALSKDVEIGRAHV